MAGQVDLAEAEVSAKAAVIATAKVEATAVATETEMADMAAALAAEVDADVVVDGARGGMIGSGWYSVLLCCESTSPALVPYISELRLLIS